MTEVSTNKESLEQKPKYVLDEGVEEYFPFQIKGNNYLFRQPNTEELKIFEAFEGKGSDEFIKTVSQFVTKGDDKAIEWPEMVKQMIGPHWGRFKEMILTEISGDNQG